MAQASVGDLLDRIFTGALSEAETRQLAGELARPDEALCLRAADLLRRFSLVLQVVNRVSDSILLDKLLPRLIDVITEALDADRATLFLYDQESGELFSRVARGDGVAEIRVARNAGIVGAVFGSGAAEIIEDVYHDARFNQEVDRRTGYRTRSMLTVPVRNRAEQVIGVTQVLNKRTGPFTAGDRALLDAISAQAAAALEHAQMFDRLERARSDESRLLEVAESISSELQLDALLGRIVTATMQLLDAERSTLFVHDPKTNELWSRVAEGAEVREIRIPADAGIAGAAFSRRAMLNIPDAYADARFNQEVDRRTGFRTRSILAAPVFDRIGAPIGAVQVLNKRGGPFALQDERRLRAFSSQIAVAIQNAQLFAEVLTLKNYNESILKSLSNGVVTFDESFRVVKVNEAARRILKLPAGKLINGTAAEVFGGGNPWIAKSVDFVAQTGGEDYHADADLVCDDAGTASVNLTAVPLRDSDKGATIACMLVFEDITREKRVRGTMARYMAKEVVDRLLANHEDVMSGAAKTATVLFSDIRRFTTLAEGMTARQTVTMLNEYFTDMVEVVFRFGGILDKYIGDAIMAIFGAPMTGPEDADNAVRVANEMIRALRRLNDRRAADGLLAIEIGVGLATGEVLAGSIGSAKRLEYTVIGDSVNLASRLESATKHYGASVLLAGSTRESLHTPGLLRRVDLMRVKGKERPTEIFESLEHLEGPARERCLRMLPLFERGMDAYRRRDWRAALDGFAGALDVSPEDGPSKVYLNRCRFHADNPPAVDWDGVWAMTEK